MNRLINTPLQMLMNGLSDVRKGRFDHRVKIDSNDEFSEIADNFNEMSHAIRQSLGQVQTMKDEVQTLYDIVEQMSRTIEWRELKKVIVALVCQIFQTQEAILVVGEEGQTDSFEILWQNRDESRLSHSRYQLTTPIFPSSLLTRDELIHCLDNAQATPLYFDEGCRVLIPLIFNNLKLGLVCLINGDRSKFNDSQIKLIPALAKHISIALANARLYHMAITGSLTRLFTKRYLNETLSRLVPLSHHSNSDDSFGILIVDIDHFKQVNDTHGHQVGDEVLRQIAELIRENIRYGDIPCRFGGEEFMVIMPELEKEVQTAINVGERLRQAVESYDFVCRENLVIKKTISVGISCYPGHGLSMEELIEAADQALYQVKNNGRNQVRLATAGPYPFCLLR